MAQKQATHAMVIRPLTALWKHWRRDPETGHEIKRRLKTVARKHKIPERDMVAAAERLAKALRPLGVALEKKQPAAFAKHLAASARHLASQTENHTAIMEIARTVQVCLDARVEPWFPARERMRARQALAAAWQEWLFVYAQTLLQIDQKIIHEKTMESSVLFHTAQSISTELDLDTLLDNVVLHAGMLLKVQGVFLFLSGPPPAKPGEARRLILEAWNHDGDAFGEYTLTWGEGPLGKVAETGVPYVDNDYSHSAHKIPFLTEAKHLLAVPIVFSDETLGVLAVADLHRQPFDNSTKELLYMYATQIAVSLKNVLLYQEQSKVTRELAEKNEMLESQADLILRKSAQLVVLNDVSQKINSSLDIQEVLDLLARQAAESIGVNRSIVWMFDDPKVFLEAVAGYGVGAEELKQLSIQLVDTYGSTFFKCLTDLKSMTITNGQDEPFFREILGGRLDINSLLLVPMVFKEQAVGLIAVDDTRETHEFLEDEKVLVTSVANHTVMAIENARLYQKVKEQAITDGLTGVYNHRFFQLRFADEYAHCKRYGNELSLIMLDIDYFKKYNDTYGHMAGDLALKEIANLTRMSVRENDILSRYGGEEFVIILPMTNSEGAQTVAERIRKSVENCRFLGNMNMPQVAMSVSLGVATYHKALRSREELLQQADQALYEAKHRGRNQTVVYHNLHQPESGPADT